MKKLLISIFLIFLVSACQSEAAIPTPTQLASETATEIVNTATNTVGLTQDIVSTNTPPNISTPYPTQTPLPTDFPVETPEGVYYQGLSPNEEWIIWNGYGYDAELGYVIVLQKMDGSAIWKIGYAEKYKEILGYAEAGVILVHWSVDGRYLYFTLGPSIDGGSIYRGTVTLQRLNLETGMIGDLLPVGPFYNLSISPNSRFLSYTVHLKSEEFLVFRDLQTGEESYMSLEGFDGPSNYYVWSPDSIHLIFTVESDDRTFSIIYVDRINLSFEQFFGDNNTEIYPVEWLNNEEVIIQDSGWVHESTGFFNRFDPAKYLLNVVTGDISELEE